MRELTKVLGGTKILIKEAIDKIERLKNNSQQQTAAFTAIYNLERALKLIENVDEIMKKYG